MNDVDMPFTSLKDQIDRLKEAADICHTPSIYIHTFKIAQLMKHIDSLNKTDNQKIVVKRLDEEAFKQFERISKGRCSCSVAKDI